jgi:hypothetical protein
MRRKEIGGRLLRRPQRNDSAATVVGFCTGAYNNIETTTVVEAATVQPKADPVEKNVRGRTTIPNEPFFDALTFEWQSAHTLRNAMIASGVKVAFGTIYRRMKKLAADFPDQIEGEVKPDRWRLRAPTGAEG